MSKPRRFVGAVAVSTTSFALFAYFSGLTARWHMPQGSFREPWNRFEFPQTFSGNLHSTNVPVPDCDPFVLPGYLNTSSTLHDSRYIVFRGGKVEEDLVVPSYSALIHEKKWVELEWLKGKSVLAVGDSIDRNNVIHFGRRALADTEGRHYFHVPEKSPSPSLESHQVGVVGRNSSISVWTRQLKTFFQAYSPELNFTMANWFLMGAAVTKDTNFFHPREDRPQEFEERIPHFFLPTFSHLPPPDLVILNAGFWDLEYFAAKRRSEGYVGRDGDALSPEELRYHRRRVRSLVRLLRKELPGNPLMMYRALHTGNATDSNGFSGRRVVQMDQSNRLVMQEEGVRVLEWGKMTVGLDSQLSDPPVHYGIGSAQYIFGDQVLFYLKQHLLGPRHEGEWEGCAEVRRRLATRMA